MRGTERERDGLWLDAKSLLVFDVFALIAFKSIAYIIVRLSFDESSVDEIYYAFISSPLFLTILSRMIDVNRN